MSMVMSRYRCAQFVRQVDSLELNLLPGVLVMHLSQHSLVSFPTISAIIAFCFSSCRNTKTSSKLFIHCKQRNRHIYEYLNRKRKTRQEYCILIRIDTRFPSYNFTRVILLSQSETSTNSKITIQTSRILKKSHEIVKKKLKISNSSWIRKQMGKSLAKCSTFL